jgi:hypothetical protein
MTTELTLQLDEKLIDKAKKISELKGVTISKLVSDYFKLLDIYALKKESELTPIVKSLKGALKNSNLNESDYQDFLKEKYL